MAALIASPGDDVALDAAVEEAMQGISDSDLSGESMPAPAETGPTVGDLCKGRVANVGSEDVLVDFGAKLLGVMSRAEIEKNETYKIGDEIEVLITGEDIQGGVLNVSRRKAKQAAIMRDMKVGLVLEGQVTGMNRGGLEVNVEGLRAFIPASQVDLHFMKDISDLIGTTVSAEVTKFDIEDENIVLSRRKVLAREDVIQKAKAFEELKVGEVRRGTVRNIADYGAFVDIGGVDGLLHVSDMSWGRVEKPDKLLKIGDEIDVKVIKVNTEKKKVSLSLKQTTPNPWDGAAEKYPVGTQISGRVVRLANFGAFVELEPGLDALLPISEMSWTRRLRSPKEMLNEGDVVEASVIAFDSEKQRISLSLKALGSDPWTEVADKYAEGSKIKAKVVRTTEFGAFVNLEDGIDGLIHISELSEQRIRSVTDAVKVGDEVEVRVLKVDSASKKISLTLRPPPKEPSPEELAKIQADRAKAEKRRNKPRRGGITIGWGVEGLGSLDPSKFAK